MVYLLVALGSAVAALIATPLARRLSFRLGIVAEPGGRRRHAGRIPKLGGLAVFTGWLAGVGLTYWLLPPADPNDALRLRGVVFGSFVVLIGGLIDDRYDLPPWAQLVIQLLGALIAILHIIFIEVFTNPLPSASLWEAIPFFRVDGNLVEIWRPLALLFTTFWVVGMINAVNFLDGLDGLAAGVCLIAAAFFAFHSYRLEQVTVPLFPLALAGALLGFLPFNFAPARIFLGSAGAYFLGYQMATLSILAPAKLSTALLVMAVPIIDVAWQIISRLRRGQHPMRGDRGHLHFRLSDRGLPTPWIVLGYYAVAILFGLVAVLTASPLVKLLTLAALVVAVLFVLQWFDRKAKDTGKTDGS
jgi:UDP-GlcNAc:undecaprenyl-phosphate GlcNAc-1-phosphate transferase